jgi:hypothetical protein
MRIFSVFVLATLSIFEIGPVPITPILLIWVVLARPAWFYQWVFKIYDKN